MNYKLLFATLKNKVTFVFSSVNRVDEKLIYVIKVKSSG